MTKQVLGSCKCVLIEKASCIYQAVLALLVAITIAAPVEDTAVEDMDTDDLEAAEQFFGGAFAFAFGE